MSVTDARLLYLFLLNYLVERVGDRAKLGK